MADTHTTTSRSNPGPGRPSRLKLLTTLFSTASLAVAGCAATPDRIGVEANPRAPATRSVTSFSQSLGCMDDLFASYGIRDIRITTNGIPDATGEIQVGTRDMLISAVSRMSVRSRAFTFIDFEQVSSGFAIPDQRLYERQQRLLTPAYYIRGSITTLDEGVVADTAGGGVRVDGSGFGVNMNRSSSLVGLDMNLGEVQTGLIVPGVSAQNRIVVSRRSLGADASFDVEVDSETVGGFVQAARSKSEGMHTAVRTLIELNTIETLGKLARVPYWRCLGVEQSDPMAARQALDYYNGMSERERIEFAQQSLQSLGYYAGPTDGRRNAALSDAVGRYQADNSLVATGRVDLQLYTSLLGREISSDRGKLATGSGQDYAELVRERLFISLNDALQFPTYKVDMPLQVQARLNDNAFMYCFYQDGRGSIYRIFPNRFQPDAAVPGGQLLTVPQAQDNPQNAGFAIIFEQAGATERVKCFASRTDLAGLFPERLQKPDLTPLSVASFSDLEGAVRQVAPDDLAVTTVEFLIRP